MANPTIPNNGEGSSAAVQTEVSNVDVPAVQCDGMTKGVPMPDGKAPKELENVFPGDADTYSGVNDLSSEQEDEYSDESGDGQLDEVNDDADSDDSGNESRKDSRNENSYNNTNSVLIVTKKHNNYRMYIKIQSFCVILHSER